MADGEDSNFTRDVKSSNETANETFKGPLKKQGKYSTKWYHCYATLEKECFVYKREDKVARNLLLFTFD